MLQKTKGIVLHTLKYNDTSIIVDMYTELAGRTSFLVPVPRSRKAAVKSVLFQPLSFIEFEADYRPNATLYRVKEAKSFYPFTSIPDAVLFEPDLFFDGLGLHKLSAHAFHHADRYLDLPAAGSHLSRLHL